MIADKTNTNNTSTGTFWGVSLFVVFDALLIDYLPNLKVLTFSIAHLVEVKLE